MNDVERHKEEIRKNERIRKISNKKRQGQYA